MFKHYIEIHSYQHLDTSWTGDWLKPNIPYFRMFEKGTYKQHR